MKKVTTSTTPAPDGLLVAMALRRLDLGSRPAITALEAQARLERLAVMPLRELAALFGVAPRTIQRWLDAGLDGHRHRDRWTGRPQWRFHPGQSLVWVHRETLAGKIPECPLVKSLRVSFAHWWAHYAAQGELEGPADFSRLFGPWYPFFMAWWWDAQCDAGDVDCPFVLFNDDADVCLPR
jgi:hypothetical protein